MNPFDNLVDRLIFFEAGTKKSFTSKYPPLADIPSRIEDYNRQYVQQQTGYDKLDNIKTSGLTYKVLIVVYRLLYRADIITDEEAELFKKQHGIAPKRNYLERLLQQHADQLQDGQPGREKINAMIESGELDNIISETFTTRKETTVTGEVNRADQIQATKDAIEQTFNDITPGEEENILTRTMFVTVLSFIDSDDELVEEIADDAETTMVEVRNILNMLRVRASKINSIDDVIKLNRKLVSIPGMQKLAAIIKGSVIDVVPGEVERVQTVGKVDSEPPKPKLRSGATFTGLDEIDDDTGDVSDIDELDDYEEIDDVDTVEEPVKKVEPARKLRWGATFTKLDSDEEEETMDSACRKLKKSLRPLQEKRYVSFTEKYKPKTSWQLDELRRYGL